jgi:hypothetical protein
MAVSPVRRVTTGITVSRASTASRAGTVGQNGYSRSQFQGTHGVSFTPHDTHCEGTETPASTQWGGRTMCTVCF